MPRLRGVTWSHTRGWAPLAVTSQVFHDHNPDIHIDWDRQSLYDFGEGDTEAMARTYDLIVMDHPMTAQLVGAGVLHPFDTADSRAAIGRSGESYIWAGQRWALAVDAACQVSVRRDDLLAAAGETVPTSWLDVLDLARRTDRVVMPLAPIDAYCSWLSLCADRAQPGAAQQRDAFLDEASAVPALELLRELAAVVPSACTTRNPIATLEAMSCDDDAFYCPLIFGYTNYSRTGYARATLAFGDVPHRAETIAATGAVLGGAGIAISAHSDKIKIAVEFATWVTSDVVQVGDYLRGGGQPAAAAAWHDPDADHLTNGFFSATRETIDRATVRPQHPHYPRFQSEAAAIIQAALHSDEGPTRAVDAVARCYAKHCG
jgi:multiple sugar transport system substrate-binding protein